MSENNTVRSSGTLQLINGKKYRGELVAGELGAAFYAKGQKEPMAEWHYARMNRMDNIRRGGTSSQITVVLKDDTRYVFELAQGLKLHSQMDKYWVDKPVRAKTRGDILHEQAERLGQKIEVPKKHLVTRRHPNRSIGGDILVYLMLLLVAVAMVFPLVFMIGSALKPLDELLRIPPPVWPSHPTLDNFSDLFVTMGKSFVPFSRYLMNTIFITVVGTFGHLVVAGMAAFVLAKYDFPGNRLFFGLVTTCLMFSGYVTGIPNYLIMSNLGMVDTYWSLILPAFCAPIGMFLMKQFMDGLPTALIEAATIDGASRFKVFWSIVMPNVKPAWLTLAIFQFQQMWANTGSMFLRSEELKPLQYALQQITSGGVSRAGAGAAVTFLIAAVPIIFFLICQSSIMETMTTSGMKD